MKGPLPLPTSISSGSSMSSPFLMSSHINPFLHSGNQLCTVTLPPLYSKSGTSTYFGMDTFDAMSQPLDSLDSLSMNDYKSGITAKHNLLLSYGVSFTLIILKKADKNT